MRGETMAAAALILAHMHGHDSPMSEMTRIHDTLSNMFGGKSMWSAAPTAIPPTGYAHNVGSYLKGARILTAWEVK